MRLFPRVLRPLVRLVLTACLAGCLARARAQAPPTRSVLLTIVDENGVAVPAAQVQLEEQGLDAVRLASDYAGHARLLLHPALPSTVRIRKPGFYEALVPDAALAPPQLRVVLSHEQMVTEQVSVTASPPGIDPEQTSDRLTMSLPEIINIPYPSSRDIRNLLPFFPGIVQDQEGLVHVAGSETWQTIDTIDNFDIRSPISGNLAMRVSADAVRSIDHESTRYPVEYGRGTGGVLAFSTGMGDNKFRFNATDFVPSVQQNNGLHFDKFVPRVTFSGPLVPSRAWFFDAADLEYDNIYIPELPAGADTNRLARGSNLVKLQHNITPANILSGGLLFNVYHSPYDGLSTLTPQQSTTRTNSNAWFPSLRDQQSFRSGALLDLGLGVVRFRDSYAPRGSAPYAITPDTANGSYFENLVSHSERIEGNAALYLSPLHALGLHNLKAGIDVDHIGFDETIARAPIRYAREDGTLERESVFPSTAPFTRHNAETAAYLEDRWTPRAGLVFEPGLRLDWDEIVRRPLAAPRLAAVYAPPQLHGHTRISAGAGLYYEHTQLEYLTRALAGIRQDTYYAADGLTPLGPPLTTEFSASDGSLREARALNWSVEVAQRIPGSVDIDANYIHKTVSNLFTYVDSSNPAALDGRFVLANARTDHDDLAEIDARRTFSHGYTLFAAYTHATAHTNAALDYNPTLTVLGPQQPGPLPWDTPNRVLSWGWLPFYLPWFKRNWDFVYTLDRRTGFPFTAIDTNQQVVGAAGADRFPAYLSVSPGLEWRFHFRGSYFGLRGMIENVTGAGDFYVVNNNIDSPHFGTFTEPLGRAFTARIRLIGAK